MNENTAPWGLVALTGGRRAAAGAVLLALLTLAGCAHSDAWKIASAQNRRAYYKHEKARACPSQTTSCAAAEAALKLWDDDEGEAIAALARKGSIKLQLAALKRDEKAVRKAGVK